MRDKLTGKQERYARFLFEGMSQREAYIQAGYSHNYALSIVDSAASRLASNVKVLARIEELRKAAEDASVATVLERKQILTEIARGDLLDYQEVGADGGYLSIGKESPNTKAISEITSRTEYDKDGAGVAVVTKVKLHSPIQAINELNKMEKIYDEGATVNIDNRSISITVQSEKAKQLTERILLGEVTE